jgi:hypothetical protein
MKLFCGDGMKSFLLVLTTILAAQASAQTLGDELARQEKFGWQCKDTGRNSMQCTVRNNTSREAELCVDVVKVCRDGDHVAMLCSGPMRSGEATSVVVHDFQPKVKFFAGCMGVEYRNKTIR